MLITELMDVIHSMTQPSKDNNDENTFINENTCLLLTKNAQRIARLSMELENMKLQQQERRPTIFQNDDDGDHICPNDDDVRLEDVPLVDNGKTASTSSSSSSSSLMITELEEENTQIKSQCESLERTAYTLKRKNTEREVHSMMSLRNMRCQIDELEQERKRRLDMQASAEERVFRLEEEIHQMKNDTRSEFLLEDDNKQGEEGIIFSLSNICDGSSISISSSSNNNNNKRSESNWSSSRSLNHCREMAMARNELSRSSNHDSFPPLLVPVSEDSDDDDHSDDSSSCVSL